MFSLFIRLMARFDGTPSNLAISPPDRGGDVLAPLLHVVVGSDADGFDRFLGADHMLHRGDEFGRKAAVSHQH
jgi:hypothetical protein